MSYPYFFIFKENINESGIEIINDDLKHLSQVLRAKPGDLVEISDNINYRYLTEIIDIKKNRAELKIISKSEIKKSLIEIYLFQCILKRSSMELVIQKAAEIGLNAVIPVKSTRVVASEKEGNHKLARWQKIALEASKQSKRDFKCEVLNELIIKNVNPSGFDVFYVPFEEENPIEIRSRNIVNSLKAIIEDYRKSQKRKNSTNDFTGKADCNKLSGNKNEKLKVGFIIGPEGGFEEKEVEFLTKNGAVPISLGSNILKAETAAIFMSSIIKYILEIY
ncbi:MAG: RsmE family RNA methyltransferase [Actinobacteria bacterium]|nr:RsmE family RNA methyltransferase [Actinomycetota bacterium]